MSVIIFLIILAILVLVHEFGHFIVAKKAGIRVDEFGLGFPPKILARKFGNTLYTLNLIPFGGFVKIFGEDPHREEIKEEDKEASFYYKPKWVQASVLVAGVTMNVLFAWLLISLGFMIGLPSSVGQNRYGEVKNVRTIITEVLPSSPADKAGLKPGDEVVSLLSQGNSLVNPNLTPENVQKFVKEAPQKISVNYVRGKEAPVSVVLEPEASSSTDRKIIGIALDSVGTLKLPVHKAFLEGVETTLSLIKAVVIGLVKFLWNVVTFKSDFSQVAGPIGIAGIVEDARVLGFVYLLSLTALISINLAVINLLPFPALDGGRLFFIFIELVIRRPIPPPFIRWTNAAGFIFLIGLMVVITIHDILKLF